MLRLSFILAILAIPLGIILMVASGIHDFGAIFARPFCDGEFVTQGLRCITASGTTRYDEIFGIAGVISFIFSSVVLPLALIRGITSRIMEASAKLNKLLEEGEASKASILEIITTGTSVNSQPLLEFRLRVEPKYGQAYETTTRRIIPQGLLSSIVLGMTMPIKIDRTNPMEVALDLDAFQASFLEKAKKGNVSNLDEDESLSEKLQELEEAYRLELITQEEYEASRQRLISEF